MTQDLQVFGYGSLVNDATHDHVLQPAVLDGWTRIWRAVPGRPFAVLSVTRAQGRTLHGAVITVPATDLPALDAREAFYTRVPCTIAGHPNAVLYEVQTHLPQPDKPILRSYLDVVLAGYARLFGDDSMAMFYETTQGWDAGLYDDRDSPVYPRHQPHASAALRHYDALHAARLRQ